MFVIKLFILFICIIPNLSGELLFKRKWFWAYFRLIYFLVTVDFIKATFNACDLNNDGLTINEIHEPDCLETLEQYGFENLTEIFLEVDANKDSTITKKEAEDAAITMMENFDRIFKCQDGGHGQC